MGEEREGEIGSKRTRERKERGRERERISNKVNEDNR